MAFLDFLRRKELCEIRTLNEQISELAADLDTAKSEINSLSKFKNISDLDKERQKLLSEMSDIQCEINNLHKQINELTITIEEKKPKSLSWMIPFYYKTSACIRLYMTLPIPNYTKNG